ncbi:unnamed protein product [Owenia fusiformis]|uniref:THAP-type domain-containing protein n=1 Tax=Owenia fusiformis TaxID=6347 RepID=A0A8S4P5S0_OWEFU|nr:unnamed protein product [Owenia fusiformis]
MPFRCVVGGCSNEPREGISLFKWPKDAKMARLWAKFVDSTRKDFTPSDQTRICSAHFKSEHFSINTTQNSMLLLMGEKPKTPTLKRDQAVPTIKTPKESLHDSPRSSKVGGAFEKREKLRDREELRRLMSTDMTDTSSEDDPLHSSSAVFTKSTVELGSSASSTCIATQANVESRSIGTSIHLSLTTRVKGVQCNAAFTRSRGCQTERYDGPSQLQQCTRSSQTDFDAPGLYEDEEYAESELSDMSDDDDYNDPTWDPEMDDSESEESDSDFEEDTQQKMPTFQSHTFFVVELSQLLMLFTICVNCGRKGATGIVQSVLGTMVSVQQKCQACTSQYLWTSQTDFHGICRGNIMLSASILFSGSSPSKALRQMKFWGLHTYSIGSFFYHQKHFLHGPASHVLSKDVSLSL